MSKYPFVPKSSIRIGEPLRLRSSPHTPLERRLSAVWVAAILVAPHANSESGEEDHDDEARHAETGQEPRPTFGEVEHLKPPFSPPIVVRGSRSHIGDNPQAHRGRPAGF
jgi:hypothetical protein